MSANCVITRDVVVAGGVFAPGHLGELTRIVPFEMVDAVLAETGRTQERVRVLPSRVVVYLLLAGALFESLGYLAVWRRHAIDARHGPVIQHRIVALRSLFRALRQERVIFRDPTRGISLPAPARLPQPLPADRVAGLLNRASGPAARLVVALVAIHAVPEADLVRLQAADLDLATGTLIIRHGYRHRVVYLDEVTAALASQWLRHRHQRWPHSRNPHLLVSQQTAAHPGRQSVIPR